MASGHVSRANRPNTWPHRPMLLRREKSLPTRSRPHMAQSGSKRAGRFRSAFDPMRTSSLLTKSRAQPATTLPIPARFRSLAPPMFDSPTIASNARQSKFDELVRNRDRNVFELETLVQSQHIQPTQRIVMQHRSTTSHVVDCKRNTLFLDARGAYELWDRRKTMLALIARVKMAAGRPWWTVLSSGELSECRIVHSVREQNQLRRGRTLAYW